MLPGFIDFKAKISSMYIAKFDALSIMTEFNFFFILYSLLDLDNLMSKNGLLHNVTFTCDVNVG